MGPLNWILRAVENVDSASKVPALKTIWLVPAPKAASELAAKTPAPLAVRSPNSVETLFALVSSRAPEPVLLRPLVLKRLPEIVKPCTTLLA